MVVGRKIDGKLLMKLTLRNSCKLLGALLISALIPSTGWSQQSVDPKSNLLINGDFSKGLDGWELISFGKQGTATVVKPEEVLVDGLKAPAPGQAVPDPTEIHNGKPSLKLENLSPDDTAVKQKVTVKPRTRYRLAGWVKVKGLEAKNMRVKKPTGASLCIMGGFEHSEDMIRTKGWTYIKYEFSSGTRSEVVIGARIGMYATPVKGAAWFSELSLEELGH